MTTLTPAPVRRAIADDRLLDTARTHRQLTDTALRATDGERVTELHEDPVDRELWHAVVGHADGRSAAVRLDRRLGTVVVHELRTKATRAA
ncbi:MAG: hypothetical protein JWM31_796 [Solirubrobacterales bacterium]|nr:hypothetical protein [Solirubrobacterales bacterium]